MDQIYLLSLDELTNPAYGFISSTGNTDTRQAVNTAYTAGGGEIGGSTQSEGRADYWWSRSPGKNSSAATLVHTDGQISDIYLVNYVQMVVRPVLHLNLADLRESWSSAGTVAVGKSTATPMPTEKPTEKPTPTPTPTPVLVPTQEPTLAPTQESTSPPMRYHQHPHKSRHEHQCRQWHRQGCQRLCLLLLHQQNLRRKPL